jgi:serine phosphatase RsbU (regulator of sigma subunit)
MRVVLEDKMLIVADIADKYITKEIKEFKIMAAAAANEINILYNVGETNDVLERVCSKYSQFIGFAVFKDTVLLDYWYCPENYGKSLAPQELIHKPFMRVAIDGGQAVSSTMYKPDSSLVMYVSAPLHNEALVLAAAMPGMHFNDLMAQISFWDSGHLFTWDREGTVISNPRPHWVNARYNFFEKAEEDKGYVGISQVVKRGIDGERNIGHYSIYGVPRTCAFRPVSSQEEEWAVGIVAPSNESPLKNIPQSILLLGIITLFFSVVATVFASTLLNRQYTIIDNLRKEAEYMNEQTMEKNRELKILHDKIANQNREITDSIIYARRIQRAILPTPKVLHGHVDMFIFYRPRDIVSGDFYWMSKKEDKLIIVVADCTGHGVPGAFMSMLGVAFLNEIVNKENEVYANEILNKLRENIISSLNQAGHDEHTKDGMDIALCVIDYPSMTLQYAGAYNSLILIRNDELKEIKADKIPVAYSDYHGNKTFTNNIIPLVDNDRIYMYSDGYADQFGGFAEVTKKYSSKRLKNTLLEVCKLPMEEQEKILAQQYDQWKGSNNQIDDVLLMGIKITQS